MKILAAIAAAILCACAAQAADYVPPKGSWAVHTPQSEGFDPAKLQAAIDFAVANETRFPPLGVRDRLVHYVQCVHDSLLSGQL